MSDSASEAPPLAAVALISVIFINMLGFGIIVPMLPFFAKSFHAEAWQIALVFSGYAFGAFFGEPFWGRLSDRYGRKPLLMWTIAGNVLLYVGLAHATNVWEAFAMRFAGGLASGNGSVVQGYISDVTTPDRRARMFSLMAAANSIGLIIGPSLGGLLVQPNAGPAGFHLPLYIAAGLSAATVACTGLFIKESRHHTHRGGAQPSRWQAMGEVARHPMLSRLVLLTFMTGFCFTGIESVFSLWAQARFNWGPRDVGLCFAFVGVCTAITQLTLTARLSERYGEATTLAMGMCLTMIGALLQPLSPSGTITIALMCVTAIGQSVAFPNVGVLVTRTAPPDRQGQILGLNNASGAMARVIGPFCAGLTFANISIHAPFIQGAMIIAPGIWLALDVRRRIMRWSAPDLHTAGI